MDKYQTLSKRFWASTLDSLILIPINIIITIFFSYGGGSFATFGSILMSLIAVFYVIFMHYRFGQTVGKMAMKVKVLDESEAPINLGQSILRSLPQLIPVMFAVSSSTADFSDGGSIEFWATTVYAVSGAFYLIDALVCVASAKHRAVHDMLAGTIVVRTDV